MRGLWLIACAATALAGIVMIAVLGLDIYEARNEPDLFSDRLGHHLGAIVGVGGLAAAAIVGLFLRPAEIDTLTSDDPAPPAAWIEEMRRDKQGDG
jgi:hypothetical protein